MNCIKCHKEELKKSEIGIEVKNRILVELPESIVVCVECTHELHHSFRSGNFFALLGLLKGI